MSQAHQITELQGHGWSVTYDTRHAPEYILLALRGMASLERTMQVIEAVTLNRAHTELPTGKVCPVIVDLRENHPPAAAVLRAEYEMIDAIVPHLSHIVFLLNPHRADAAQLQLALETIGLMAAPNMVAVTSLADALAQVRAYHQRHTSR